jgi:hypothetical protein
MSKNVNAMSRSLKRFVNLELEIEDILVEMKDRNKLLDVYKRIIVLTNL